LADRNISETDENWDSSTVGKLATIRVVFEQVRNRKNVYPSTPYFKNALPAENPLDEKSKKAGHHGAR
jgi:hypothetical protein